MSSIPNEKDERDPTRPLPMEDREQLLRTKLFILSIRSDRVTRPRLSKPFQDVQGKSLFLVSAPAGYGKTTLVSSWLYETGIESTWLSLDEGDNDLIRFLQYFLTALHKIVPTVHIDLMSVLQGRQPSPVVALVNIIINEITTHAAPFVLVLDDFHTIHAQPILDMVTYLLENIPPQLHLVLISRTDPLLPLSQLRARNQLVEIRADQLRFTREEIGFFLNQLMGLGLSNDDIAALEIRTEGWIASLQLAAVSMQGAPDVHRFVSAFTGSHYYIMDYLTEEVLKRQPERVRQFLLQTSILDRLCGSLCEAVIGSGDGDPTNGQAMLEDLEHKNLFLIPLDGERRWFRYHHLFADVLNRRLEYLYPHQPGELHQRASQWYEQNGFVPEAIQHSLAAGDQDRATRLIEQNGVPLLIRGEVTTLLAWIESVEAHSQIHPWLYIYKAWAFALTGYLERVNGMLQAADELISTLKPAQGENIMQGAIAAARAHQANLQGLASVAAEYARQALNNLTDNDPISRSLRTVAAALYGDASSMSGNLEEAEQAYMESASIGQAVKDVHLTIVANSNLANILVEKGSLRQAARIYSDTLRIATRPDSQKAVIAGRVYLELSQLFYEWNQLETASEYVHQGLALCQQWGNMDLQAVGYLILARLEHVQRHLDQAQAAMRTAEQIVNDYTLAPRYSTWVKSALARLWVGQGDLGRAAELVQKSSVPLDNQPPGGEITFLQEPVYLILLRLYLAQRDYESAINLSERLMQISGITNRAGRLIEIFVLQALSFYGKNELALALAALEKALSLAQSEGYCRIFLDEGGPMAKLLFQAKLQKIYSGYSSELLSAFDGVVVNEQLPAQLLVEPLSRRELEVLKLIESGCSNQDIADKLVISLPTVKRHISNIYAKLGVESRTQAVSLGKELKLFP